MILFLGVSLGKDMRVLAMPFALIFAACIVLVITKGLASHSYLSVITYYFVVAARAVLLCGLIWLVYNFLRLCLMHKGKKTGDCPQCNWWMTIKDGRYGIYRKCSRCGATKKGGRV